MSIHIPQRQCGFTSMLELKLQYFGHLMQRANSLEKTLMLGKIEDGWTRGQVCVCVSMCAGDGGNRALEPRPVNSVVQLVTCRT